VLEAEHSYYGGQEIPMREDDRWEPGFFTDLIARQLTPEMTVLDVGCGKGHILMEISSSFRWGLGIDNDPRHIRMAEELKREQGVQNVDFRLLDYAREIDHLGPESFDMVISIRGPVPDSAQNIQAAYDLLRPDGSLFCQEIGELHHQEVAELFEDRPPGSEPVSQLKQYRDALQENGFEVRLAADIVTKKLFPDIYAWLRYMCNIWSWLGTPLPEADDPRIGMFAGRHTTATGEIEMTGHVSWIGCVKKADV
jgi:SAM-dependent methyltransferase